MGLGGTGSTWRRRAVRERAGLDPVEGSRAGAGANPEPRWALFSALRAGFFGFYPPPRPCWGPRTAAVCQASSESKAPK